MGAEPNEERSREWIHSSEKREREKRLARILKALFLPLFPLLRGGVLAFDGSPVLYKYTVAFPGPDGTSIKPTEVGKFRTLREGADRERDPFETTVFQGGKKMDERKKDPRVHSEFGWALRVLSLDEIPQLESVVEGDLALIGPRGYTEKEIEGLHFVLDSPNLIEEVKEYLSKYREIMAQVAPRPGVAGPYAAIRRKLLTPTERLISDKDYCERATKEGDNRLFAASFLTALKRTGAG